MLISFGGTAWQTSRAALSGGRASPGYAKACQCTDAEREVHDLGQLAQVAGRVHTPAASTVRVMTDFSCNGTPDDLLARHKLIYQDVPLRHPPGLDLRLKTQTQRC